MFDRLINCLLIANKKPYQLEVGVRLGRCMI